MGNWGEIPMDVAREIAEHIYYWEDFEAFGEVCTLWKQAKETTNPPWASRHIPCLMLAEPPCTWTRQFYSLCNHKVIHHEFPDPKTLRPGFPEEEDFIDYLDDDNDDKEDELRYLSSKGWLLCITQLDFRLFLVHVVTKQVIRLPLLPYEFYEFIGRRLSHIWVRNFALSEDPLTTDDFTIAATVGHETWVWCSKDNVDEWTVLKNTKFYILETIFYKRDIYGVGEDSEGVVYMGWEKTGE